MQRREFLQAGAAAAAAAHLLVPQCHLTGASTAPDQELQLALIGGGRQGQLLLSAAMAVGNVRVRAVCDIWPSSQSYCQYFLRQHAQEVALYEDFRAMLDRERELDAVLVATPDFVHAEQVTACLEAGRHVYCEPMMAHNLAAARTMVQAMRRTGRLLQIGYQRRSDPRYRHAFEKLIADAQLLGRPLIVQTQWAQREASMLGWPKRGLLPDDVLRRYGYDTMSQFRNWIWYPALCGGPYCRFVSHQLDVCQWFLEAAPRSVMASGGTDCYQDRPSLDTVLSLYEYPHAQGTVRVSCSLLTTTSADGARSYERLLGTEGSLQLSEDPHWTRVGRETSAPDWDRWVQQHYVVRLGPEGAAKSATTDGQAVHVTGNIEMYQLPVGQAESNCQAHLENFFAAVRGEQSLRCPADVAFPSQVAAFKALEAARSGGTLQLAPSDFDA